MTVCFLVAGDRGVLVSKKLPIEQYLADNSTDRRAVYARNMRERGNRKVTYWVPDSLAEDMRQLAAALVHAADPEAFRADLQALATKVGEAKE